MALTGEQVRAARAMARIEQVDLAERAGVSVDTIKRLERTAGPLSANVATVEAVQRALESAGIEFTNGGQPGVRMRNSLALADQEKFLFDSNIFDQILKDRMSLPPAGTCRLLATRIQIAELSATPDVEKRSKLLAVFREVGPELPLTSSFAFDIEGAGFNQANWNDGTGNYERMLEQLKALDSKARKRKGRDGSGQIRDVLIAETAMKNGAILVTVDKNLRAVVEKFGGRAIDFEQFCLETANRRGTARGLA